MANTMPDKGREGFLSGSHNWMVGTWVPYVMGSWNASLAGGSSNRFLSDIGAGVWRARGTYLTTPGAISGEASAANTTVVGVGSAGSATAVYIVLVNETGASQTSLLGPVYDTATGLPFLPNGGDIQLNWQTTSPFIFKL